MDRKKYKGEGIDRDLANLAVIIDEHGLPDDVDANLVDAEDDDEEIESSEDGDEVDDGAEDADERRQEMEIKSRRTPRDVSFKEVVCRSSSTTRRRWMNHVIRAALAEDRCKLVAMNAYFISPEYMAYMFK